jgi:hypothetical protein
MSEHLQSPIEKQILELFRQCGIICFSIGLWNCPDSVALFVSLLNFGTIPTMWHYATLSDEFQCPMDKPIMPHCRKSSKVQ